MEIQLRDPKLVMKLSRLGSFHQSKLSFLRSFLKEFKDWEYRRDLFNLDDNVISKLEIPTGNPLLIELENNKISNCKYLDKERAKDLLVF